MADGNHSAFRRARSLLFPAIVPAFKDMHSTIAEEARGTRSVVAGAFSPYRPDPRVAAVSDPKERFKVALFVAGRGERDLPAIEQQAGRTFELYAVLTLIAVLWLFVAPALGLGGASGWRLADLMLPVGVVLLIGSKAFATSVALYRIQRRSLVPVREFLRDPNAWLGGKPHLGTTLTALAIGLGLGHFLNAPALAQGAAVTAAAGIQGAGASLQTLATYAGAEDLSLEWLRRLFPGMANLACPSNPVTAAANSCAASNADVLGAMMGALNSILCGFGSIILAWHTIAGTVATAHEGKVMGQRWHTMWAPVRVCLGFGMLVPVKGYCGAQFAVLLVIVGGYNMANGLWSAYIDKALSGEMASVAASTAPSMGLDLAHSVLGSETCVAVLDNYRRGVDSQNRGALARLSIRMGLYDTGVPATNLPSPAGTAGTADVNAGHIANLRLASALTPTKIWDYGTVCGLIRTSANDNPGNEIASALGGVVNTGLGAVGSGVNTGVNLTFANASNQAYSAFITTRDAAVTTLITSVRAAGLHTAVANAVSAGQNVVVAGNPVSGPDMVTKYNAVRAAAVAFDASVDDAAKELVTVLNSSGGATFKARAQALGWASAGGLNSTMVRAAARAQELVTNAAPRATGPNLTELRTVAERAPAEYRTQLEAGLGYLGNIVRDMEARGETNPRSTTLGDDMQGRNLLAQIVKPITDSIMRGLTDKVAYIDPVHPIADIQNLGNLMLAGGWSGVAVLIAAKSGGGFINGIPIVGGMAGGAIQGALEALGPIIWTLLGALFICGTMHAYILPMLPFLLWFYAIIAVVSLAAELVIAAPLAAFMHIRADGQELINAEQRTIYMMSFNALLRPSLLLCGLVVSNLVLSVSANFLNKLYGVAVTTTNGDSVVGVMGFISLTVLAFYMHYQMVVRSMHLITAVPAMVSSLLQVGDQERGEKHEGNQVFAAIGNVTRSGVSATSQGLMRGLAPKPGQELENPKPRPPTENKVTAAGTGGGGQT